MSLAWQFVKMNGFTMSEALKTAWANIKLKAKMHMGIVKFRYEKLNGEIRTAWGTLKADIIPQIESSNRKHNRTVVTYYDTERESWRSFKAALLIG